MKKTILIVGSLITLILAILWYKNIITEPLVAVGTGIITLISLIFIPDNKNNGNKKKVRQKHSGEGDNIGGDKIINTHNENSQNKTVIKQTHSGEGDNIGGNKIINTQNGN